MTKTVRDLVVIGGGPGGYGGAIRAAQLGMDVVLVEKDDRLGGTCLLRGCIPTKALLHSAGLFRQMQGAADHGIKAAEVEVDYPGVLTHKDRVVEASVAGLRYLMDKNEIEVRNGTGRIVAADEVEVTADDGSVSRVACRNILVATGSSPCQLDGVEIDGVRVVTSDELLGMRQIPESLIVLGGGSVGVEFASVFAQFGSRVSIIELLPRLLPNEDEEISDQLGAAFRRRGIACLTDARVDEVVTTGDGVECTAIDHRSERTSLSASVLLVAVGRTPFVKGLGLDDVAVRREQGFVSVDKYMQTSVSGVYAVGDVLQTPQLAHVAAAEARVAAEHMAGVPTRPIDYLTTPSCTYSDPEVASVGLTEKAAREAGYDVAVGRFPFTASGKARILDQVDGLVKVVADREYDEVLGVHIIGASATELIAEAGMMRQAEVTTEDVVRLMHPHPTLSEAIQEAMHDVHGTPVHF
ncbi:MAG: dihydrolipoyl dehydrogenase [Euryarchaeota archaeon]|jgi:dihydrolipoamide dehydrogenase|nr:dihydrolipoyl dehydrogenase [Euryarchaeota archaeon]|tara:strand:+ start:1641 stop:3044 length:1404 start_codon:yes stop_codon:yes gene_type:complete